MKKKNYPKSGAVAKVREVYNELRRRPLSEDQRKELEDVFKKRDKPSEKTPKKIAKPDRDAGLA